MADPDRLIGPDVITGAIAFVAAVIVFALLYAVVLLSRIARGLNDLQEEVDDLRTRLGVLDPGETRVAEAAPDGGASEPPSRPARSPDETLPGS